jgi:hypothetical protein
MTSEEAKGYGLVDEVNHGKKSLAGEVAGEIP